MIFNWAMQYGSVKVIDLAKALDVNANTIRGDLDVLEGEGRLVRVHGGATIPSGATPRPPYSQTRDASMEEKSWIGAAALAFVPDEGTIFIGSGSTTYQFATGLIAGRQINVVTNALDVAAYLALGRIATVDLLGGRIGFDSLESDLTLSDHSLDSLNWDVAFMGTAAIDITRGITTLDRDTARAEQRIIERAGRVIALCDSSKVERFSYARVGPVDVIDVLITDTGASPVFVEQARALGIEVVVAGPRDEEGSDG